MPVNLLFHILFPSTKNYTSSSCKKYLSLLEMTVDGLLLKNPSNLCACFAILASTCIQWMQRTQRISYSTQRDIFKYLAFTWKNNYRRNQASGFTLFFSIIRRKSICPPPPSSSLPAFPSAWPVLTASPFLTLVDTRLL